MAIDVLMGMRVFTKVVELKSFARAAEKLDLSRGMTSRYVAQVEEHLGLRLINRTTRHLALTEAGDAYYQKAIQILALVAETQQSAANDVAEPRGTLRISSSVAFGGSLLGRAISTYLQRYPQVKVNTHLCERVVDLIDEGYDLAIRVTDSVEPGLVARPLTPIRFVVCASPDYLRRHGTPVYPAELADHNCLLFTDYDTPREWRFKRNGATTTVRVKGSFHGNNGNILCDAAANGLGIIYQPSFLTHELVRSGQLVRLFQEWETDTFWAYAVYPHRKFLLPKVRSFIDFMVEHFGPHPYWDEDTQGS
jgi:DNA-binding transcriptional LysR family regulator